MAAMQLTRTHRVLIGVVVAGALIIAGIGFAGSYAAVRELAEKKGFGDFSLVFPIGIDAGICVLLALDLLLTWMRIPFPLLRQTAWLLTAATIAFNGAAAWPDPLGVGMHAVIPVLFVVAVEAARHAVGRIADITADKHMEGVRLTRWLLSPVPTFRLWRRMKLWELRSYEQVIKLEQDRMIYQARLQARFGRAWRRKAPVEALMPLRLAKYGVPLAETAPAGLAAAGIEPVLLPPDPTVAVPVQVQEVATAAAVAVAPAPAAAELPQSATPEQPRRQPQAQEPGQTAQPTEAAQTAEAARTAPIPRDGRAPRPEHGSPVEQPRVHPEPDQPEQPTGHAPGPEPEQYVPSGHVSPWFSAPKPPQESGYAGTYDPTTYAEEPAPPSLPAQAHPEARPQTQAEATVPDAEEDEFGRAAYEIFRTYVGQNGDWPSADVLDIHLADTYGLQHPRSAALLRRLLPDFKSRYQAELEAEHIA
ncbi:DUF2637 domain-containing protein [Streptomyces sp. TRM49041]|uniref:DUF2637 domain-containing protein n=1 Tax=Streptomyces sp. TRM49041 TaxID=2603216 RepID=UPI0016568B27|nr:DUF2637 domain-containing protein [Streptomyces sp. TRM49041]